MRSLLLIVVLLGCSHSRHVRIIESSSEVKKTHQSHSKKVMVTSQGQGTTRAALWAFGEGGNIIDAFVAASFAISVERPHSTGIGGGGFLLYFSKKENKVYAFDFRETAPRLAFEKMYLDREGNPQRLLSQEGALAVGTPGLVKGLYDIHRRFGKLSWNQTLTPAIKLARQGFPLYPELHRALEAKKNLLIHDPEAKKTFYTSESKTPSLGRAVIQENLARTLEEIAKKGERGFYRGRVARSIIKTIQKKRGLLTHKDLRSYKMKERTPVSTSYKGHKVFSMPPPSSGGVHVIGILKMLAPYDLHKMGAQSTKATHLIASAMQRAFLDRALYLGDPDFHQIPTKRLVSEDYLLKLSREINSPVALKKDELKMVPLPYESPETTHFTIADHEGNMIASTQTINGWFGAGMIAQGTGIFLNNEMDDFAQKVGAKNLFGAVGGKYNLVQPNKRPLSSMSPTIITTPEGEPVMALGSPSGTRIITCVAQTILNALEFKMPLFEAVAATRIHQQWQPDELKIEAPFLSPQVENELKALGHKVVHEKLGCSIQAIKKEQKGWVGVSDPRGEGLALGED